MVSQMGLVGSVAIAVSVILFFLLLLYCLGPRRRKNQSKPQHRFVGNDIELGGPGGRRVSNPLKLGQPASSSSRRRGGSGGIGGYADLEAEYPTYEHRDFSQRCYAPAPLPQQYLPEVPRPIYAPSPRAIEQPQLLPHHALVGSRGWGGIV